MEVYVITLKELKDHLKITEIFIRGLEIPPYVANYYVKSSSSGVNFIKNIDFILNSEKLYTFLGLEGTIHDCKLGFTKENLDKLKIPISITKKAIFKPNTPSSEKGWFWQ